MKIGSCPNPVRAIVSKLLRASKPKPIRSTALRSAAGPTRLAASPLPAAFVAACSLSTPAAVVAQDAEAEIAAVVDAYHAALASGDSVTALGLLADDVVILESGGMEDKAHYRSGHLAGDMRFARAVPADRDEMQVDRVGDVAWAWSTSTRTGTIGDREIDSRGAELMVLQRLDGRWLIKAIHWSSRSRS